MSEEKSMKELIEEYIGKEIRPYLQADGGDVQVVEFKEEEGELYVKLQGACHGCPAAQVTLKHGIEERVQAKFPAVKKVLSI